MEGTGNLDTSDRDFSRYLSARVLSVVGAVVAAVAMPVLVYQLTGSAGWTSAVTAAEALPYLVFGLLAGALADRLDRRKMMVALDLTVAAVLLSVPLAWTLGALTAPHVVVVAFTAQTALPLSLLGGVLVLVSAHWLLVCVAAVYWGAAQAIVVINGITYRQQVCPEELQSRVNTTARMLAWGAGHPLGAALAGAVSVAAGDPRAGLGAGVAVLAGGVVLAWVTPVLRRAVRTA